MISKIIPKRRMISTRNRMIHQTKNNWFSKKKKTFSVQARSKKTGQVHLDSISGQKKFMISPKTQNSKKATVLKTSPYNLLSIRTTTSQV